MSSVFIEPKASIQDVYTLSHNSDTDEDKNRIFVSDLYRVRNNLSSMAVCAKMYELILSRKKIKFDKGKMFSENLSNDFIVHRLKELNLIGFYEKDNSYYCYIITGVNRKKF